MTLCDTSLPFIVTSQNHPMQQLACGVDRTVGYNNRNLSTVAKGIATRSKGLTTRNKKLVETRGIATSNKCLTSSNLYLR